MFRPLLLTLVLSALSSLAALAANTGAPSTTPAA